MTEGREAGSKEREELQRIFVELLGERFKKTGSEGGGSFPLGEFHPLHAEEVSRLSRDAARHGVPVVASGGGTSPESPEYPTDSIVVNLGFMQSIKLRHDGGGWAEAEPGTLWLALDNELRQRGKGLAVYPTSAPRATVGGWLATDGLGIGSFGHGWLRENVLAADVVLPGGELCEVTGSEVPAFVDPGSHSGIVVSAKLRTRRADTDRPFAIAFEDGEALLRTLSELVLDPVSTPLWHAGFLSPAMARLRGLPQSHLMFGAYPGHRAEELEDVFWPAVAENSGESLGAAEAYRVWGGRFAPITPSSPTPTVSRDFTNIEDLLAPSASLSPARTGLWDAPVQGTLSRSGQVLILTLQDGGPGDLKAASPEETHPRDQAND
ncbi:FAD-binding oxidoreductase [Rubrobacter aplysinae]|uniref:FAD-binding oxidoreductase n=1 Tax=Rubrobacter aplysinae TaxID=909625 RepID=UPI00064BF08F|nr:FAD-dependent oxidoreductase [Rubrobacter aplysinae]